MKKLLTLLAISVILAGCTSSDSTFERIMKQEGIENAYSTGYKFFACSNKEHLKTGFVGYKNGQQVTGVICDSLFGFRGATIRYY